MRRILIVSLLVFPMLFSAAAKADMPEPQAAAQVQQITASAGISAPDLVYSTSADALPGDLMLPHNAKVILSFEVDEEGTPTDFRVINSTNPILEDHVVNAVSRFRFQPGMLDREAVPLDMNWAVEVGK